MKARQNARKNPRGKRTTQGGTSQKRPPLILAPHLGRVASSSFSLRSPLLCLSLARTQKRRNRHRRYGRMRAFHEPRHDGSSILAFRSSWQVHGSMAPWPRNPHRALCSPCAITLHDRAWACRDRILLWTGAVSRLHIEPKSTKPRCVPHIFIGHRHRRRRLTKRPLWLGASINRTLARTTDAVMPIFDTRRPEWVRPI